MIRVLADANVLISAALGRSARAPSALILEAALDDKIELLVSAALLAELRSVLARPRLRRYLSIETADRFLTELPDAVELVGDPPPPHLAVCRDPKDDYLIALARSAAVDHLVSGDQDLLSAELDDVSVVTPRELVDRLGLDR